jgi:hypothetical protein
MRQLTIAIQLTLATCFAAAGGCDALTKPVVDKKPEPPPATASVKAGVGVAKQGRSLDSQSGLQLMVSYPAVKFFQAKERIVFEIQIPPAIQRFKAIEGRFPKTHEEFMTRVIKENMIQLPELPQDRVYRFNTETGELYVDPAKQDNAANPNP